VILWIIASAVFALYVANFSSYNATWRARRVIVFLIWLWITNIAVLPGAEVNARSSVSTGSIRDAAGRVGRSSVSRHSGGGGIVSVLFILFSVAGGSSPGCSAEGVRMGLGCDR
jgi:hypothetical protein